MAISIGQMSDWILNNRRGNAFRNYTKEQIIHELNDCYDDNTVLCVVDKGQIMGICCFKLMMAQRIVYVLDILTTHKNALRSLMHEFHNRYEGFAIEGRRRNGRQIHIENTQRLQRLVD